MIFYANLIYDLEARLQNHMPGVLFSNEGNYYKRLLTKMCTSVIIKSLHTNSVIFGSNFDMPQVDLSRLIYQENYYRNNELVSTSVKIFGIQGAIRGYSHKGGFFISIISINEREVTIKGDNI